MINDRMHIIDRISNSVNSDDNKSTKDFSDAQSIRHKKKNFSPYKPGLNNKISINLNSKFTSAISKQDVERSRSNNGGFYYLNKSLKQSESEDGTSEEFRTSNYVHKSRLEVLNNDFRLQSLSPTELRK